MSSRSDTKISGSFSINFRTAIIIRDSSYHRRNPRGRISPAKDYDGRTNDMSLHDEIIASMLGILAPLNGEIRLLGRVNDPLLSNPSEKEAFFFIPDLHLISPERQSRFG